MSREAWTTELRLATAINTRLRSVVGRLSPAEASTLVVEKISATTLRRLTTTPGTLALAYHGGFPLLRRAVFQHLFEKGIVITARDEYAAKDGAYVLFAAREAILGGHPVLIAPDGGYGKESGVIHVLGAKRIVADGAPFLAYVTACPVVWLTLRRTPKRFALEVVDGPQVEPDESFSAYRERFYAFYAARLEEAFTDDPRNIAMLPLWTKTFEAMLKGTIQRKENPSLFWKSP